MSRLLAGLAATALTTGVLSVVAVPAPVVHADEPGAAPTVRSGSLDVVGWDDALVGDDQPDLSWVVEDADRDEHQTAYQVEVSGPGGVVWDSGEVSDDRSTVRPYEGPGLESGTAYTWRVRVWDADATASAWSEPATLRTGLLDLADWEASWLAVPSGERTRTEFDLGEPVVSAVLYTAGHGGFVARLNGERVSDEELGSSWTDFGQRTLYRGTDVTDLLTAGGNALGITVGAGSTNEGSPTIDVMAQLEVVDAGGVRSTLVSTGAGWRTGAGPLTRVDPYRGERFDARLETPGWDAPGFDDAAWTPSVVAAPVVGAPLLSTASGAVASAQDDVGCCGWSVGALNDGALASSPVRDHPQGYHSTAAGSPDTTKWAQVDLGASRSIASVELYPAEPANDSSGTFPGAGFPVRYRVETSDDPTFATAEVLADRTGEDQPNPGITPVVLEGSATARYVRVTTTRLRTTNGSNDFRLAELLVRGAAAEPGWALSALEADPTPVLRVVQSVDPVGVSELVPGVRLFDFGQNYSGWVQLSATAPSGTEARVYLGEVLDGAGRVTTANLDFAPGEEPRQDYRYTFAGTGPSSTETWEPQFVYSGFRYAEVSGLPPGTDVTVTARVVHNDLQKRSTLDLDDPTLQGISGAVERAQLNAAHGVPEDTPTREKKGWTGDALSGASSMMTAFDADTFYRKYLRDMQTSLFASGAVPSVAPSREFGTTYKSDPAWGSAYPVIVWAHFLNEGDPGLLETHYDDLVGWVDYLGTLTDDDHVVVRPEMSWGSDWQAVQSTPPPLFHTAYYLRSTQILADAARALGRDADAERYDALATDIADGLNDRFLNRDAATYSNGSQLANAFPLLLGVVPDDLEQQVLGNLVADVRGRGNHLSSGFVGTQPIIQALHAYGRDDVVLDTGVRDDYPSLGYMVKNGPGTIWETWQKKENPDGTSSKDHPALGGGMEEWFYQGLAGIEPLEPGYRRLSLTVPDLPGHDHAAAAVETPLGTVSSDWTRAGDDLTHAVEVPVGATADVVLPASSAYAVSEGGLLLDEVDGVREVAADGRTVTVTVGSGSYEFAVTADAALVGAILEDVDAFGRRVAALAEVGDLADDDRDRLDTATAAVRDDLRAALMAGLDGDGDAVTAALESALAGVRDLRGWLAGSDVDGPVRGELDALLAAIETRLVSAVTAAIGVTVILPPVVGEVLPGGTVSGTVEVTNDGSTALTGLIGTVSVEGLGDAAVAVGSVAAGGSVQLPVSLAVPRHQDPGGYDAELSLDSSVGTLQATTPDWVTITSGLEIGEVTAALDGADPAEHATVSVPVSNTGAADVRAHVALTGSAGWASVPSADVLVPAGGETTVEVPVVLPLDRVGGAVPVTVDVRRAGVSLATTDATLALDLPRPPTAEALDHVDLGDAASEGAHAIEAGPHSGTNTEAGLTRRYADPSFPGSWYSVEVAVPVDGPFLLRNVETFDGATTKKYLVSVDGTLVKTQLVPRTEGGAGIKVYDALVDDPAVFSDDGTARVRFEYPVGAAGFYDPSLADLWVLPVPLDTVGPDVSAVVADGVAGDQGWYRSAVDVTVAAADGRDPAPVVEVGGTSGWQAYVGPVPVVDEGRTTLAFRATDAAGNRTTGSAPVWIDTVAPTTELSVASGAGPDRATLSFASSDATSGVAVTSYRIDGGAWLSVGDSPVVVDGFGDHVVEYAATDVAGNPEAVRRATVSLADVDTVTALLAPQVSGTARVGSTLSATAGTWNTSRLTFAYQWLRDGRVIGGASRASYRPVAGDVGRRLAVRVTATKAGVEPGVATSTATAPVARAASTTKVAVGRTVVAKGRPVRVTVSVTSRPLASGRVQVRVDARTVRTLTLRNGKASATIRIAKRGRHQVDVRYPGSRTVAPSTSMPRAVRVT